LKGSLKNQKWCLKEPFFEGSLRPLHRFFEEELFKEPWFERFFMEPYMGP